MKIQSWLATVLLVALVGGSALADDPKAAPKMSAEEKAAMDAMMAAATPGAAHKALQPFAGKFDATVTMWPAPGAPPSESKGASDSKWVLGGRWLEQTYTGSFMGMPFNGIGYTGYDNVSKQYVGTWMDSFSTGPMTSTGSVDAGGKTWSFTSTWNDPVTGKATPGTQKVTVADNDHHTMEFWGPAPDGTSYKMMEIRYTRKN